MMLAPWVLLPVILALRGRVGRSVRRLAGQAGVAVALMGAVNAVATLTGCLPAVIWWACHRPNRRWWRFTAWWLLAAGAGGDVVAGRADPAGADQPAVPGLHRVLRRDHAVDVADRGAARHRQLDAVRRAQRDRGCAAGHRVGRRSWRPVWSRRPAWPGWRDVARDARARPADRRCCSSAWCCWPSATAAAWARRWPTRCRRSSTPAARRCATCTSWSR